MPGSFRAVVLILALPVLGGLCVWKIVSLVTDPIARDQVVDVIIESELSEYRYRCEGVGALLSFSVFAFIVRWKKPKAD